MDHLAPAESAQQQPGQRPSAGESSVSPGDSRLSLSGILAAWLSCAGVKATYQGATIELADLVSERGILPYVAMRASLLAREAFGVAIPVKIRESRDALFGYEVDPIELDTPLLAVDDSVSRFALVAMMVEAMTGLLKLERYGQTVKLEHMQWPGFASEAKQDNSEAQSPVRATV